MKDGRTWFAAVLIAALGFHVIAFLGYAPGDVYGFNRLWFRQLAAQGLVEPVGNYAPPYIYLLWGMTLFDGLLWQVVLIKLLSLAGAVWMAFAAARVLQALHVPPYLAALTLALPSVILNASLLGQADTFWIAPCLLATAAAIEGKYDRVSAWSGLAFAVKAQAAVFAPFVIYLLLRQRAPWQTWLFAPGVLIIAWAPAWLAGWPLSYLATIYSDQTEWVAVAPDHFIGSGASLWTEVSYFSPQLARQYRWLAIPLIVFGLAFYWRRLPNPSRPEIFMIAAIIGSAGVPFLLPLVRDRFFMLADVLAFLLAVAYPSRRAFILAALVQAASAFPMLVFAFRLQPWDVAASPALLLALFGYFRRLGTIEFPHHAAEAVTSVPSLAGSDIVLSGNSR